MPEWTPVADLTINNLPNFGGRGKQKYRVTSAVNSYLPGIVLGIAPVDSQIVPDFQTVQPLPTGTTKSKIVGVVSGDFAGFDGQGTIISGLVGSASFSSPSTQVGLRGTPWVDAVVKGVAYCFVDQSGSGAVTITDGIPIVSSRNTAGFGQGVALATATNAQAQIGVANLPASGIGSSLTAAALAQATQTFTVATPATGDICNTVIQGPYTDAQPGTAQTNTYAYTIKSTDTTATIAAASIVTFLNAQPSFSLYFTATSAAGVVTVTVNALSNPFLVTGGSTGGPQGYVGPQWRFFTHISGMVANSLTTTASVTGSGGTTYVAGGATFSGGTGYYGRIPIMVFGEY